MKQYVKCVIAAFACAAFSVTDAAAQRVTLNVGGVNRTHIEYAPKNLGKNRPLLISCHGSNQDSGYQQGQMKIESIADTAKFLTVFPDGIDRQWDISGDRDINYILALIDEMARKYDIDRNRVYLSGFSMGGMLTYHAMNKIADKIAAFAPISGYPLWGSAATSSRPVPILHTQGTGDEVVSADGIRGVLDNWIVRNHCSSAPKEIKRYKNFGHANLYIWGGGDEGVEVRLLELIGKGHWVSNDGVLTGEEIWLFCKNYSLNKTSPVVSITSPQAGAVYTSFAQKGEAAFPSISISADASDSNGQVEKVDFYDGDLLIASCTTAPYSATLETKTAGTHVLKVVATDNDGESSVATMELVLNAPTIQYVLSQSFNEASAVPAGWITNDGNEQRVGYSNGYTLGCRVLEFTGNIRSFNHGLYFRNVGGSPSAGYAKYGLRQTGTTLTLAPGKYALKYRICNWNQPNFSPVDICIEKEFDGQTVAQHTYTPSVNIGNVASNSFSGVVQQTFEFDIEEPGNYVLAFYTADTEWADCVIGQLLLTVKEFSAVSIDEVFEKNVSMSANRIFDIRGRAVSADLESLPSGFYILDGKKIHVK